MQKIILGYDRVCFSEKKGNFAIKINERILKTVINVA